jgi:hypothetical protein
VKVTEKFRLHYPLPIAKQNETMRLENQAQLGVQETIDLVDGTVQYMALVGLALCLHNDTLNNPVKDACQKLRRPSLDHWVGLLRTITDDLSDSAPTFLSTNPFITYKDDSIAEAVQTLKQIGDIRPQKPLGVMQFMDAIIQFRNKKIWRGNLSRAENRQVSQPLEAALNYWLKNIPTLYDRRLLHIAKVEWQTPAFVYTGTNLNAGTSLDPFRLEGDKTVANDCVYLHLPASGQLISLYPFLVYESDTYILFYPYSELSKKKQPILKYLYDVPGAVLTRTLNLDQTAILIVGQDAAMHPSATVQPEPSHLKRPRRLQRLNPEDLRNQRP